AGVSGAGINSAQRVMDCGDAGHILLSSHIVDQLRQLGDWEGMLHDLGECEVKHGKVLHLYNLYADGLGNPERPLRLPPPPSLDSPPVTSGPARAAPNVQPSETGAQ